MELNSMNERATLETSSSDRAKGQTSSFNWVTERSNCSVPNVFATLRRQIEQDVKTRNALRPESAVYEFSMLASGNEFLIVLTAGEQRWTVLFVLHDHSIVVKDTQGEAVFEITVEFNEAGECKLKAKDEQWEFWQVRRMALEELMFRAN